MKPKRIAITGGTGFVGRHVARQLLDGGHEIVLLARGMDNTEPAIRNALGTKLVLAGLNDENKLVEAFAGCDAVAHCAGINREIAAQTYQRVHVEGTHNVVNAARRAGVPRIALMSFLRARPDCGSPYHESKWAAEEIVRASGLDYTVFKCGVIYGGGDHMLNHLSRAFHTFPLFGFVGFTDQPVRPTAVEDIARIVEASLVGGVLSRQTVAVVGPQEMGLRDAVRQVARVVGRKPLMFPLPLWFHYILGWVVERVMVVPMVSTSQVRMLAEGVAVPLPPCAGLPEELRPKIPFTDEQIRRGLPPPKPFGFSDLLLFQRRVQSVPWVFKMFCPRRETKE